jgi:hypothetical protein
MNEVIKKQSGELTTGNDVCEFLTVVLNGLMILQRNEGRRK